MRADERRPTPTRVRRALRGLCWRSESRFCVLDVESTGSGSSKVSTSALDPMAKVAALGWTSPIDARLSGAPIPDGKACCVECA